MTAHPEHLAAGNSMDFLSDDGGKEYNHCHCTSMNPLLAGLVVMLRARSPRPVWSNFEIGDLDFWRGKAYSDYFDFLEKKGGFYVRTPSLLIVQRRSLTFTRTSSTSDGGTRPYTASEPDSSLPRTKSSSSSVSSVASPTGLTELTARSPSLRATSATSCVHSSSPPPLSF